MADHEILFRVETPLGFSVQTTRGYWDYLITFKHRSVRGREALVRRTLEFPLLIRRSRKDSDVYLFYGEEADGARLCVVAKQTNGDGFLITAYFTENVKEGELIWTI